MSVADLPEFLLNREYERISTLEDRRVAEFHKWMGTHPQRAVIADALAYIAEILALDDLRCKAAGYQPRSSALHNKLIPTKALDSFKRIYEEARH